MLSGDDDDEAAHCDCGGPPMRARISAATFASRLHRSNAPSTRGVTQLAAARVYEKGKKKKKKTHRRRNILEAR